MSAIFMEVIVDESNEGNVRLLLRRADGGVEYFWLDV